MSRSAELILKKVKAEFSAEAVAQTLHCEDNEMLLCDLSGCVRASLKREIVA